MKAIFLILVAVALLCCSCSTCCMRDWGTHDHQSASTMSLIGW